MLPDSKHQGAYFQEKEKTPEKVGRLGVFSHVIGRDRDIPYPGTFNC